MTTPSTFALRRARADWLAGDADAWARYLACLRRIDAAVHRRPARRRPRRPAAKA